MKNKIIIFFGLAILVVVVAYLYLSSPGEVVVDEKGEVVGLINKVRETIQGIEFWRDQLREVDREIDNLLSEPQRRDKYSRDMAESRRDLDRALLQADKAMEEIYKKMPEARPSPAEQQAEALRELADRIEMDEVYRRLEVYQLERIVKLRNTRLLVQVKTK